MSGLMSTRVAHAAAIDVMTGELTRLRFRGDLQTPVAWLKTLLGPVRACYEAGPTGFGLYRAAVAAGIQMEGDRAGQDAPRPRGSGQDRSQGTPSCWHAV